MDDSIRLDGFDALRLADIARIRSSFKNRAFYVRGLASKRRTAATNASYNLISTRALLESIQANNALLTIEREAGDADGTDVGRITSFARHDCAMRTISPGAVWRSGRERIAYKDITRIGFGSEYDETIAAVAQLVSPLWR